MLTSLRIQNFRSIRDAEVRLGQVNLFIGPNNSGKSNYLKGIEFATKRIADYPERQEISFDWYEQSLPRWINKDPFDPSLISVQLVEQLSDDKLCEANLIVKAIYSLGDKNSTKTELNSAIKNTTLNTREELSLAAAKPHFRAFPQGFYRLWERSKNIVVYKPDPSKFNFTSQIRIDRSILPDASNIISFLYNLREDNRKGYQQLEEHFAQCVGTLETVSMPLNPDLSNTFKLKFSDKQGIGYWAEEVSEGVLYFIALLCIVHQPNPPKLLLLEEPEKGIHPRRIKEVMDFIFELAELRDIQIIITSHSPYVVDHFADIPECISVFDRENGETVVRNAADIIKETNAKLNKPIRYSDALGEHWVSGFLGGVPA